MARTVPVMATQVPGNFITSALWNSQVGGLGSFTLQVPIFRGYQTAAPSLASAVATTPMALDSENVDSEGGHSTTTNTSRYVCQVAGWYWISSAVTFGVNSTGSRAVAVMVNGGAKIATVTGAPPANSWNGIAGDMLYLNVNDYVETGAWQNSGVAMSPTAVSLTLFWVSQ
jgi:hypothetical protein